MSFACKYFFKVVNIFFDHDPNTYVRSMASKCVVLMTPLAVTQGSKF